MISLRLHPMLFLLAVAAQRFLPAQEGTNFEKYRTRLPYTLSPVGLATKRETLYNALHTRGENLFHHSSGRPRQA